MLGMMGTGKCPGYESICEEPVVHEGRKDVFIDNVTAKRELTPIDSDEGGSGAGDIWAELCFLGSIKLAGTEWGDGHLPNGPEVGEGSGVHAW